MSTTEQLMEEVLILRCQIGDKEALRELITRYHASLRYFVSRLMGDIPAVEDIFQDTWLTVIRKIHTLKEARAFSTWLFRVARHYVYKELKRRKRLSPLAEDIPAANEADDTISLSDDVAKMHRCLEKLRLEHKEVLLLYFLEDMSYEQIARVTDCNSGTVKSRMYYAKRALKKAMEE